MSNNCTFKNKISTDIAKQFEYCMHLGCMVKNNNRVDPNS